MNGTRRIAPWSFHESYAPFFLRGSVPVGGMGMKRERMGDNGSLHKKGIVSGKLFAEKFK